MSMGMEYSGCDKKYTVILGVVLLLVKVAVPGLEK